LFTLLICILGRSVPAVVKNIRTNLDDARVTRVTLGHLGVELASHPERKPLAFLRDSDALLAQLAAAGNLADEVNSTKSDSDRAWSRELEKICDEQRNFWNKRAMELCDGAEIPLEPPLNLVKAGSPPVAWLEELKRLEAYRAAVFKQYDACHQESRLTIDETRLRFEYTSDTLPKVTDKKVQSVINDLISEVDKNVVKGNKRKVFVFGHSDSRGACNYIQRDNRNYRLSYGRAWYLAQKIKLYLAESYQHKPLVEGKDYLMTVVGHGASRPKTCEALECRSEKYDTENRRIEIAFQRLTLGDLKMMKAFPTDQELGPPRPNCGLEAEESSTSLIESVDRTQTVEASP